MAWGPPGSEALLLLVHEEGAALLHFHPVREGAQIPPLLPLPASLPRPACSLQWKGGRSQTSSLSLSVSLSLLPASGARLQGLGFTTPLAIPPFATPTSPRKGNPPLDPSPFDQVKQDAMWWCAQIPKPRNERDNPHHTEQIFVGEDAQ